MPETTLEAGSNKARMLFARAQAWERRSRMWKPVPEASLEEAREEIELPATLDKGSHTTHNSLSDTGGHISPGCREKRKACWLKWSIYHPRKRMKMIIDMLKYKKHEVELEKDILVTTTIEVAFSPALPSPRSPITFSDEPCISLVDLASDEEHEGQEFALRPITAHSHSADAKAGAERVHERHHSIPSSRPFSFHQLIHLATRPRSGYDDLGHEDHSILAREAESAECLERATVMSATTSGTEELDEKQRDVSSLNRKRTRYSLGKSFLGRLGFGKMMRRKAD